MCRAAASETLFPSQVPFLQKVLKDGKYFYLTFLPWRFSHHLHVLSRKQSSTPTMSSPNTFMSHRERMTRYEPTPRLDKVNPIQRYLHKGGLEPWDWARLAFIVVAYLLLRPYFEWLFKKYFDADPLKTSQEARQSATAKAKISPNAIRGVSREVGQKDPLSTAEATTSGFEITANDDMSGRRSKGKSAFTAKTLEQQLLDWDDIEEIPSSHGPKGEVSEWVRKWDRDERTA